jgi:hypothetical protein
LRHVLSFGVVAQHPSREHEQAGKVPLDKRTKRSLIAVGGACEQRSVIRFF